MRRHLAGQKKNLCGSQRKHVKDAKSEYERIVKEADARAGSIIESAKADIRVEREQTMNALQSEIAGLAMTAAAKIVADQAGNNQAIYDKFLEEVGEAHEDRDDKQSDILFICSNAVCTGIV